MLSSGMPCSRVAMTTRPRKPAPCIQVKILMRRNGSSKPSSPAWMELDPANRDRGKGDERLPAAMPWAGHGAQPGNPHGGRRGRQSGRRSGPDGELYLFPRIVAKGNFSRIGIAGSSSMGQGTLAGWSGWALPWSLKRTMNCGPDGGGGCEDPRITLSNRCKHYVMTCTQRFPRRARIALAVRRICSIGSGWG